MFKAGTTDIGELGPHDIAGAAVAAGKAELTVLTVGLASTFSPAFPVVDGVPLQAPSEPNG